MSNIKKHKTIKLENEWLYLFSCMRRTSTTHTVGWVFSWETPISSDYSETRGWEIRATNSSTLVISCCWTTQMDVSESIAISPSYIWVGSLLKRAATLPEILPACRSRKKSTYQGTKVTTPLPSFKKAIAKQYSNRFDDCKYGLGNC